MKRKITLSIKLTGIFTLLIFVSVFFFSFLMISTTKKSLERQQTKELLHFLSLVEIGYKNELRDHVAFPSHAIPYYILYRVSKADGSLLHTNDALLPILPNTPEGQSAIEFREGFFIDGNLNLRYVAKNFSVESGETYHIQVAVDLHHDNAHLVLQGLPPIFLLFSLPLLILCSLVAFGVSSRILQPLRKIIQQAQEITSEKLDSRLEEGGAKDELQELAITFNQLFSRLEEDFELQRRFTSDAAHELKTPLAVISGHVDLLCRWGKDNPAVLEESLQTLQKESRSMSQLIEKLLQLTRTENNQKASYPKEKISLQEFLQDLIKDFQLLHPEAEFLIDCSNKTEIFCNQEALQQLLRIFIQNSLNYSDQPAFVAMGWNQEKQVLWVQDKGWGIENHHLPHLFDRFYRVDEARNRRTGGTGLGLSIAKALAEKLDISLEIQSLVGQGTTIFLTFLH